MTNRANSELDFRGDLQGELMSIVWRLGEATVDEVRAEQADGRGPAYNTVQTVLNRLVERGLLVRSRRGRAFVYKPVLAESEYLVRSIGERLAGASPDARRTALLNLVDELEPGEVDDLARRANRIRRSRKKS